MEWLWGEKGAGILIISWCQVSVCAGICDAVIPQCRVQELQRAGQQN
jgi:hypothetical protein